MNNLLDILSEIWPKIASSVVIVVIAFVALRLLRLIVKRSVKNILEGREQAPRDLTQKAQTIAGVVESTGRVLVLTIAGMMLLTNLGMDIAPLLASAGIAGIAIGFGAQNLVRDFLNGFLVLVEGQYAVGDIVTIGGSTGTVEDLNLRYTLLRSVNGAAIVIPNGEVRVVENLSKGWSRAVLDIRLAPYADDEQVMEILREVVENLQDDEELGQNVLEPPVIIGLFAMDINQNTYRVMIRTEPLQQWAVERAVRRRIRRRLIEEGVPFPDTVPSALAEIMDQQP